MKTRLHKRSAFLLAFVLLLIGLSLSCVVWVRKEQRQYGQDRQLIAALMNNDAEQALLLVNAGADPNTTYYPSPPPSLHDWWQVWHRRVSNPGGVFIVNNPTAIRMACGERWLLVIDSNFLSPSGHFQPSRGEATQLVEAMLQHGATPDLGPKDHTPLQLAQQLHNAALIALLRKYSKHR